MSSISSDAALERRRQQNRDAQRKRRNNLKAQIEELQARNSELEALKESAFSGITNQPGLIRPRSTLPTPDASCGSGDSSCTPSYEPSVLLNWNDGVLDTPSSATSQGEFPALDDDVFMRDICMNWKSSITSRHGSEGQISNAESLSQEVEGTSKAIVKGLPISVPVFESGSGPGPGPGPSSCENEGIDPLSPAYMSVLVRNPASTSTQTNIASAPFANMSNDDSDDSPSIQRRASVVSTNPANEVRKIITMSTGMNTGAQALGMSPDAARSTSRHDGKRGAMVMAVANRQAAVVRMLLKHGADVNARGEKGRTVLHDTAEKNDAEMMHLLLDHGADPNIVDKSGMMPIEIAAFLGNIEALEVLLTGASNSKRDQKR